MDTPYIPSAADAAADDASKWAGQLVLDRALVKPGDTLHVTGGCMITARGARSNSL
jgi:hypothetical protein